MGDETKKGTAGEIDTVTDNGSKTTFATSKTVAEPPNISEHAKKKQIK
jgi:hypothetical protein